MAAPYLRKRRNRWYVRTRVPADLRDALGHDVTRSLETADYDSARRRAASAVSEIQAFFREMRRAMAEMWLGKPVDEVGKEEALAAAQDKGRAVVEFQALSAEARQRLEARLSSVLIAEQEHLLDDHRVWKAYGASFPLEDQATACNPFR